jgi:hypothetical protein
MKSIVRNVKVISKWRYQRVSAKAKWQKNDMWRRRNNRREAVMSACNNVNEGEKKNGRRNVGREAVWKRRNQ